MKNTKGRKAISRVLSLLLCAVMFVGMSDGLLLITPARAAGAEAGEIPDEEAAPEETPNSEDEPNPEDDPEAGEAPDEEAAPEESADSGTEEPAEPGAGGVMSRLLTVRAIPPFRRPWTLSKTGRQSRFFRT